MSDPFLILHKVHSAPAFDIAERHDTIPTGEARYNTDGTVRLSNLALDIIDEELDPPPWWIIPTSGHRAYPWWWVEINNVPDIQCLLDSTPSGMPDNWPDHYQASEARSRLATAAGDLLSLIGLKPKAAAEPVKRRVIP
jgi:hypothetical protein